MLELDQVWVQAWLENLQEGHHVFVARRERNAAALDELCDEIKIMAVMRQQLQQMLGMKTGNKFIFQGK